MQIFISLVLWLIMGALNAYYANTKGRDPIAWFMLGIPLGLLGLVILYFLPALKEQEAPEENYIEEDQHLIDIIHKDWFYLDDKSNQQGPIPFHKLKTRIIEGKVKNDSLIWSEGMDEWKKLNEVPLVLEKISQ